MINPITQLLMTKRAELNEALRQYELMWRKGDISFKEYSEKTKRLIKEHYMAYEKRNSQEDTNKDKEPTGLLGMALRIIRRLS